jgi:hypothetical protein
MMVIENKFNFGDVVYLKTDNTQQPRIMTGMSVRATCITYELTCGVSTSWHWDFEISYEKDLVLTTIN